MAIVCKNACKIVPEIIDVINGDGPKPDAITIGGTVVYFKAPTERIIKHEHMHVIQAARYCPWWGKWLPLKVRAWLGAPRYWKAYAGEHWAHGYAGNKFELEAIAAEGA